MKKSTKVKKTKVSKVYSSPKRLRKFDNGGRNILSEFTDPTLKQVPGLEPDAEKYYNPVKTEVPSEIKTPETTVSSTPASSENKKPAAPKAKLLPGGFSSEANKAAYIKNVKARMAKGATLDQLVKERVGTRAGLESLGFKDAVKSPAKNKKSITLPKNNVLSSVGRKGLANTASTPLPKNSKVPLKNKTNNGNMTASELKQKGLQMKKQGQALKQKGAALKEKAGDKQYWKSKYYQDLVNKAASGKTLSTKERDLVWDKTTKKKDYGQKVSDKENMARTKILKGATDKGREIFTDAAVTTLSVVAPGVIGKALGRGVKALKAAKAAKVLKVDKIIKPITKAIPRSTNAGKTIKVNGRTVSEGSQKLLGNGQKMLGNGQKMLGNTKGLPAPKKGLPAPKISSKISKENLVKARTNRVVARNNKSAKIEASIKTNNPVARNMARTTKYEQAAKKGSAKIKQTLKNNKAKNAKPKPGDQLKLNLRKGGKVTTMRKGGKK